MLHLTGRNERGSEKDERPHGMSPVKEGIRGFPEDSGRENPVKERGPTTRLVARGESVSASRTPRGENADDGRANGSEGAEGAGVPQLRLPSLSRHLHLPRLERADYAAAGEVGAVRLPPAEPHLEFPAQ